MAQAKLPEELLRQVPTRRLKSFDGMAVTAGVWDEAHDYHYQQQRFHALLAHGPGIVAGLEVIASSPADSKVSIQPGIALDAQGQTIVLAKAIAYDLAQSTGPMQVRLSYRESRPTAGPDDDSPRAILSQYEIAAMPVATSEAAGGVELARVRRSARDANIVDAVNPLRPGLNEIDMRFRRDMGVRERPTLSVAWVQVGADKGSSGGHAAGAAHLAQALNGAGEVGVFVDYDALLDGGLACYGLVMLAGAGAFQLARNELGALYDYIKSGGTVFMESCRRAVMGRDAPADATFVELASSMGFPLKALERGHPLLAGRHLFATLPPGFETNAPPAVLGAEGLFLSYADYGCLWQGDRRTGPASREEIRAAHEWGGNLVHYALQRRSRVAAKR